MAQPRQLRNVEGCRVTAHLLVPGSTFTGMTARFLLEAIAASPSLHELVVERGDVETDTVLQQNIDVLERNGGGMSGDDGAQRPQGRLARAFIGDATQIGVEIEAVIHGHVSSARVCCVMGSADIRQIPGVFESTIAPFNGLGNGKSPAPQDSGGCANGPWPRYHRTGGFGSKPWFRRSRQGYRRCLPPSIERAFGECIELLLSRPRI
jgi:hypothetical protein